MAKKRSLVVSVSLIAATIAAALVFVMWLAPGWTMTGGGASSAGLTGGSSAASAGGGIYAFSGGISFRAMAMAGIGLAVCFLLAAAVAWLLTQPRRS